MRIATLETIHTTLIRRKDWLGKIIAKEEEYLTKMIATIQEKTGDHRHPMNILDGFIAEGGPDDFGKVTGIYAENKELCEKYDTYTKLREEEVAIRQALEDFERQNW